ncbi:uncharacterized protein LOC124932239 [Impatiens glandulifera]|uniref:uncharacterized protein LOC124932239 n=1 Tax=Impatiens glandulifera TaxID=253017 RepID=UPI001FB054EE|nr:uncharacterized protein LOC124932239 [Impatiens glandulifera]
MRHSTMKPISSPGRTEKFPPPLMRFLKNNVGSKSSRRRYRSTPMFFRKKTAVIEPTQEPSSPKVTCIGQVRVRRSSNRNPSRRRSTAKEIPCSSSCMWVKKSALSCFNFVKRKWFSPFGYCRKGNLKEEISPVELPEVIKVSPPMKTETESSSVIGNSSSSPPKNAFLLTRCRSAPYRSTSLASRFLNAEKEDSNFQNSIPTPESRMDHRESESSVGTPAEEVEEREKETVQPLILTRSKSEPARTGEKINPEIGLSRPRRLGLSDNRCSPRVSDFN